MMDAATIGTLVGGILGGAGTAWGVLEQFRRKRAEVNADVARERAETSVYTMMTDRLSSLEKDVSSLRLELA
jgi:Na+/glutamate symporter